MPANRRQRRAAKVIRSAVFARGKPIPIVVIPGNSPPRIVGEYARTQGACRIPSTKRIEVGEEWVNAAMNVSDPE